MKTTTKRIPIIFLMLFIQLPFVSLSQQETNRHQAVLEYLLEHRKANGAFGPKDQSYTDLAWNYPAVHSLALLDYPIDSLADSFENGSKSWMEIEPWKNGPWYWSLFLKTELFTILNRKEKLIESLSERNTLELKYVPRKNYTEFQDYSRGEYFDLASLHYMVKALNRDQIEISNKSEIIEFVSERRIGQGGWSSKLDKKGRGLPQIAHLVTTFHAVSILQLIGAKLENKENVIDWIQSLQDEVGGFVWTNQLQANSNSPDIWYTWCALKLLHSLNAPPRDSHQSVEWILSLQNKDGGFGDRPGWNSRLMSTYYALHALKMLNVDLKKTFVDPKLKNTESASEMSSLKIYQAHHKAPATGNRIVEKYHEMGVNIAAIKLTEQQVFGNSQEWLDILDSLQNIADRNQFEMTFVAAPENYKHRLIWNSGMPGNHVSNFMIPPSLSKEEIQILNEAYTYGLDSLSWLEYVRKVILPIQNFGTLFYPELDYTMMNAYMVYDDAIGSLPSGYNAIAVGHFGNYDWIRHFPYREKWIGQLPMIADGDAHGDIDKWVDNINAFRNLYLAKDHAYESYIKASKNDLNVCVIRMPNGEMRYYGAEEVISHLKQRMEEWKWW